MIYEYYILKTQTLFLLLSLRILDRQYLAKRSSQIDISHVIVGPSSNHRRDLHVSESTEQLEMSRRVLVLDGLWYSLCPSFSPLTLTRPNGLLKQRNPSSRPNPPPALRIAAPPRHRCYSSNVSKIDGRARFEDELTTDDIHDTSRPFADTVSRRNEVWGNEHDGFGHESTHENHNEEGLSPEQKRIINKRFGVPRYIADKSNDSLETLLQTEAAKKPNITSATHILRLLIRDRGVKPSARHYKALIMANSDALHGSPMFVRSLLEEMEKEGITADSGTLHAALQVCPAELK